MSAPPPESLEEGDENQTLYCTGIMSIAQRNGNCTESNLSSIMNSAFDGIIGFAERHIFL